MQILENVVLKNLTTFKVGGSARFFVSVHSESEVEKAVLFAHQQNIPFFILGGGSNIVISDKGFSGLVIKMEIKNFSIDEDGDVAYVTLGAGEIWDAMVERTTTAHLSGIENLSYIPGTVGAAPVQNIGAYGVEIKDVLCSVRAYDAEDKKFIELSVDDCELSYRSSIFKKQKKFIVVSLTLRLSKKYSPNFAYKDIQEYIENKEIVKADLSAADMRAIVIDIRKKKLPDWRVVPTAGSFFKNPEISTQAHAVLKKRYPQLPGFVTDSRSVKIPLAWIIEHICELKGEKLGGAAIFEKHALVIINKDKATSSDIEKLAERVALCVYKKTGILVENEVQLVKN
jgi:UDP-N-acetylmuramate dehydrogenase